MQYQFCENIVDFPLEWTLSAFKVALEVGYKILILAYSFPGLVLLYRRSEMRHFVFAENLEILILQLLFFKQFFFVVELKWRRVKVKDELFLSDFYFNCVKVIIHLSPNLFIHLFIVQKFLNNRVSPELQL